MINKCFITEKTEVEIKEFFKKETHRLLKQKETLQNIKTEYRRLASFRLNWSEDIETGILSKVKKTKQKKNTFYLDLDTAELYYIKKNFLGKKELVSTDTIKKIADLPPSAIDFLSDILKHGSIKHTDLNKKHFLFLDNNFDMIRMLKTRELIDFDIYPYGIDKYYSHIILPEFDSIEYDLTKFLITEKFKIDTKNIKNTNFEQSILLELLERLLDATGELGDLYYLPTHIGRYIDKKQQRRDKKLICPRFIKG